MSMGIAMLKVTAFATISALLCYLSRFALLAPGSHGFYRFFAWECLALFLLNVEVWFRAPLAWHQLLSWMLLIVSIVPLEWGIRALTAYGKPVSQREGETQLPAFEKTSSLVTTGIYHYIRSQATTGFWRPLFHLERSFQERDTMLALATKPKL